MGGSGAESPEDKQFFTKFVKIGNGKLKNNHFSKIAWIFWEDLDKNIWIIENSLKIGQFVQNFAVLPYYIKDFRVYLIDIGSHILT